MAKFDIIPHVRMIPIPRTFRDRIIIHHSGSRKFNTARTIDRWHRARGFREIGYHFFIQRDGLMIEGRGINLSGAHTRGHNRGTIGICVDGNFSREDPNHPLEPRILSVGLLVATLMGQIPDPNGCGVQVLGHRELAATECPGLIVDLDLMRNYFDIIAKQYRRWSAWYHALINEVM